MNARDGSLRGARSCPLQITEFFRTSTALGDLDGDGDADAAVSGGGGSHQIEILEGGRALAFTRRHTIEFEPFRSADLLAIADLDGDGDLDLISGAGGLSFLNDRGTLAAPQDLYDESGVRAFLPDDLDGDGDTDLALATWIAGFDVGALVLLRNQAGSFIPAGSFPLGEKPAAMTGGDLDGDGLRDLAIAEAFSVGLLFADGSGAFAAEVRLRAGSSPAAIAAADLDGDGDLDLATGNAVSDLRLGNASVFLNQGTQGFAGARNHGTGPHLNSIAAADFDLDGHADLLAAGFAFNFVGFVASEISLLRGLGKGLFAPAESIEVASFPSHLTAVDLDRDGDADVACIVDEDNWRAFIAIENLSIPRSADADGDGVPDECRAAAFRRGDFAVDGQVGLEDAITLLHHLFVEGRPGLCLDAGDADDSGRLDLTDAITLLVHLFQGGGPLPPPWPGCGRDPTPDAAPCARFDGCS